MGNSAERFSIQIVRLDVQEGRLKLRRLNRFALTAVMTTAMGTAMVAVPAFADSPNAKSEREIERREVKLEQAVRKHGERSHQAEQRRHDLNAEREGCWNSYHGWWS